MSAEASWDDFRPDVQDRTQNRPAIRPRRPETPPRRARRRRQSASRENQALMRVSSSRRRPRSPGVAELGAEVDAEGLGEQRVGDHHPRHEDEATKHATARGRDHHCVGLLEPPTEALQRRAGHLDPALAPQRPVLPDNRLPKVRWMSIPRRMRLLPFHINGSGGRHDTYGSALSAQPGELQRRPATNASSKLIEFIDLPHHCAPGGSVPDGRTLHHGQDAMTGH